MQTSLRIDGANCATCFNETLDALARVDGVRAVHGSLAGPCIEVDHDDVALEVIQGTIRGRLHGIEMFSNEIRMVPLEPTSITAPSCPRHHPLGATPDHRPPGDGSSTVDPSMTLGEIVTLHPSLAAELERRGLDYCCHGARTLDAAAREVGLDPETVADELSERHVDEPPAAWASLSAVDLVDHIESVHHGYLWTELPRISALVDKIVSVHGDRHPELVEVQRLYTELRADLEPHLSQEEQVVFPLIRQSGVGDLAGQIDDLTTEHETVGQLLEDLRRATGDYAVPTDACATYAATFQALAELEADTHLHVHKENNVLFRAFAR